MLILIYYMSILFYRSIPKTYDITIVGAGIVGLATARHLSLTHPNLRCAVIEKEATVGVYKSFRSVVPNLGRMLHRWAIQFLRGGNLIFKWGKYGYPYFLLSSHISLLKSNATKYLFLHFSVISCSKL